VVNISSAVNQNTPREEEGVSVGVAPRLQVYNEDLRQIELELSRTLELAVAAEN
jgi:hypothetical protein